MRKDKNIAIKLRTHGKSYRQIKKQLGIPLSTLSDWFRNQKWSNEIAKSLTDKIIEESRIRIVALNKQRGLNLDKLYREARSEAQDDFEKIKYHPLFVTGVMLYWGEGDKASEQGFRISNSDPNMIKLFLLFLIKICRAEINRIKASLIIYPDLDGEACRNFWSENTGLPKENFTKNIIIVGRHKSRRLNYGVCNLSFSSKYLKEKMRVWIDLLSKELLENYKAGVV